MAVIDSAMESGLRSAKDRASGQTGLFAELTVAQAEEEHPLPKVPDWTPRDKLTSEKEMLGFYITGHPLDEYKEKVEALATHKTSDLEGLAKNTEVAVACIMAAIQRKRTKEGKAWALLQIEDHAGAIEAMVFSTAFEGLNSLLNEDKAVLVRGLVYPEENAPPKLSIKEIIPLEVARLNLPSLISIRVPLYVNGHTGMDRATELQKLFQAKPGEAGVRLRLEKPRDFSVILDLALKVRPDKEFRAEVARICGAEALEILAG